MSLYSVFTKPEKGPEALETVRQGFSWEAFLLVPLWAILLRAWIVLPAWIVVILTLEGLLPTIGLDAAIALYVVFALWVGFAAPQIREGSLERRAWIEHGQVNAHDRETAEITFLTRYYGYRP